MNIQVSPHRSVIANAVYGLLNPIPFGSSSPRWFSTSSICAPPRSFGTRAPPGSSRSAFCSRSCRAWSTLCRSGSRPGGSPTRADKLDFWLNLFAIVAAIFNAFVHSRDAYAVVPAGVWLSACTVILLSIGRIVVAVQPASGEACVPEPLCPRGALALALVAILAGCSGQGSLDPAQQSGNNPPLPEPDRFPDAADAGARRRRLEAGPDAKGRGRAEDRKDRQWPDASAPAVGAAQRRRAGRGIQWSRQRSR